MKSHIATLAAAGLASFVPAVFAGNMSLTIAGEASPIEILSYSFGAQQTGAIGGGGGGAGKAVLGPFSFSAVEGPGGPTQFRNLATGQHLPTARLIVLNPDTGNPHSEWALEDVLVTSFNVGNGAPEPKAKQPNTFALPMTTFSLAFVKACYRVFAPNGGVAKETCYNQATNTAS